MLLQSDTYYVPAQYAPPMARIYQSKGVVLLPDGIRVDLSRRPTLWRIFLALGRAAQMRQPMTVDDVFLAGWNGERALPAAIRNRVYVAVSTLRRYGLTDVLHTGPRGYLLSPEIRWVFEETQQVERGDRERA